MAYLHWNYALVLGIETPCIIVVIGVQAGGHQNLGQSLSIFWAQTMTKLR